MFDAVAHTFTLFVYQPFFNILVFFYWVLDLVTGGNADMGIAVILLTLLIRVILLPLSLAGHRSERERRDIASQIKTIEDAHAADPILVKSKRKKVLERSKPVIFAELFALFVQVTIAIMLWRIFKTGLTGDDIHLIYPFMPDITIPEKIIFLNRIDLSETSFLLNLIQSLLIFVMETLNNVTSPYRVSRGEVVRMQLILPVVSFLIFMALPAGKKLFVITTLIFSIVLKSIMVVRRKFEAYKIKKEEEEAAREAGEDAPLVKTIE